MNIQLKDWKIKDISLFSKREIREETKERDNNQFQISFGHTFNKNNVKEFLIGFKIDIDDNAFDLKLEIIFAFETDMDAKDIDKRFLEINAPAIAFPYIRSYISNLTLQSGYPPIILPSINFVSLSNRNK